MSEMANPAQLAMEDFLDRTDQESTNTWWLALSTELFRATSPSNGLPTCFKGNTMCPAWDKLIFSPSPTSAITTLFYHATEMHVQSNDWKTVFLLSFIPSTIQQNYRLGCGVNNLFNRGYKMATQLQFEAGHKLVLSTDEASTLQLWQVATIDVDGNSLGTVANNLSWDNGFLWHYNMPIPVMQIAGNQHPWFRALVNSL